MGNNCSKSVQTDDARHVPLKPKKLLNGYDLDDQDYIIFRHDSNDFSRQSLNVSLQTNERLSLRKRKHFEDLDKIVLSIDGQI